jgi:hypothetical protein
MLRCPYCLEDTPSGQEVCRRCDEPLTPAAEVSMAPPALVARLRELRRAGARATDALVAAIVGPMCCFIFGLLAISYSVDAMRVYRQHGEPVPARAIVAIVIAGLWVVVWAIGIAIQYAPGLIRGY